LFEVIEHIDVVPYGRPATVALARAVDAAKAGRLLAPVTVVVPSNVAGLSARRLLGSGELVGTTAGGAGIANVQFVTPFRLAELLASTVLPDRRPLTNPVLGAAVRRALADAPGVFAPVAGHQATEAAVALLYAELSHVSPSALDAIAASGVMAHASVDLFERIRAHLEPFHGEDEMARAAAAQPDLAARVEPLGRIIWYLPAPLTAALAELLTAVVAVAPSRAVVGVTGDPAADRAVIDACRAVGVEVDGGTLVDHPVATGSEIVSVTDADEEVRAVVRQVAALAEQGVRLDRIGVFHPTADPYVRIIQQQFAAAGIAANGTGSERLADSVAGRTLLAALDLPAHRWRRDKVMALVAGAPIRTGDGYARPAVWERLSRQAGVVQGLDDWTAKLAMRRSVIEARLDDVRPTVDLDDDARARGIRERGDIEQLDRFVRELAGRVAAVDAATSWRAKAEAAVELLVHLLGRPHPLTPWPGPEQDAMARVEDALTRLSTLDDIAPGPNTAVFTRALSGELDVVRGRAGRFGEGVVYGPLASAIGHDLDAVFVLGLTEGRCPRPRRDDSLLPDSVRQLASGELALRAERLDDQHRALLAALAAAPPGRRWMLYPRGDLRGGRQSLPSRWLLDTATVLAGRAERVHTTDFAELDVPAVRVVRSFAAGVHDAPAHGSLVERDLASLMSHRAAGGDASTHPAAADARRGLVCQHARASRGFTEFDGNLGGHEVPSPTRNESMSATRLEKWAECGFRYFLGSVLGLADRDDPERIVEISALDKGSAVHEVLERFIREALDAGPPTPDDRWSGAQRSRLHELAAEVLGRYEREGRTGRPVLWRLEKDQLALLLDGFLDADDDYRRESRATPHRAEFPFGFDDVDPVLVELSDGRQIAFRGMADRVDRTEDGSFIVSDYKTGRGAKYVEMHEGDPVRSGTALQLGLYSEAAIQQLGAVRAEAYYWIVDLGEGFDRRGYDWDEPRRRRFVEVVEAIVDGVEAGVFPMVPGDWDGWRQTNRNCTFCDFDQVCPRDRGDQAEAKIDAPELRVRDILEPVEEVQP
jgi:ATP-dependent helicase/nuclease subunit B